MARGEEHAGGATGTQQRSIVAGAGPQAQVAGVDGKLAEARRRPRALRPSCEREEKECCFPCARAGACRPPVRGGLLGPNEIWGTRSLGGHNRSSALEDGPGRLRSRRTRGSFCRCRSRLGKRLRLLLRGPELRKNALLLAHHVRAEVQLEGLEDLQCRVEPGVPVAVCLHHLDQQILDPRGLTAQAGGVGGNDVVDQGGERLLRSIGGSGGRRGPDGHVQHLGDGGRVEVLLAARSGQGVIASTAVIEAEVFENVGPAGPVDHELSDGGVGEMLMGRRDW